MVLRLPLDSLHRRSAVDWTEDLGYELPRCFTDAMEEQRAVAETVGLLDESYRGVIDLVGAGIAEALEKVVSSRVGELEPGYGQPSCLLSAKGRLVGAFHLYALEGGDYRLVFREPLSESVCVALERYMFLADIEVVPQRGIVVLALQGPRAIDLCKAWRPGVVVPEALQELVAAGGGVILQRGGQTPEGGCELWVPTGDLERVWTELGERVTAAGGQIVGYEASEALRVEAGVARWSKDYTDESFPNEIGWEPALKYDKCYVGQEIVARMRTYGQVHRQLRGLVLEASVLPPVGAVVQVAGQDVGVVTSAAHSARLGRPLALALIKRKAWQVEQVRIEGEGESAEAAVVELPFVPVEKSPRAFPDEPVS